MKRSKSRAIILMVSGLFLLFAGIHCMPCTLFFSLFEKKNEMRNKVTYHPSTGVVLDAETRRPIAGAQVMARVDCGSLGIETRYKSKYKFGRTDEKGRYRIPRISCYGLFHHASDFRLIIYKAGYVAYHSWRVFKGDFRKDFKYKKNLVLLEKWDDKKFTIRDHVKHVRFFGCDIDLFNASKKKKTFCREARNELILACKEEFREFPSTRDRCEYRIVKDLGLIEEEE